MRPDSPPRRTRRRRLSQSTKKLIRPQFKRSNETKKIQTLGAQRRATPQTAHRLRPLTRPSQRRRRRVPAPLRSAADGVKTRQTLGAYRRAVAAPSPQLRPRIRRVVPLRVAIPHPLCDGLFNGARPSRVIHLQRSWTQQARIKRAGERVSSEPARRRDRPDTTERRGGGMQNDFFLTD